MKVLVVCEDPTHDQYIAKPVVEFILEDLGLSARVEVLLDPCLRGIDQLANELPDILLDNKMVQLLVIVADRDGGDHPEKQAKVRRAADADKRAVVCFAVEEIEIWMLALHRGEFENWQRVRADRDVKDNYAVPFLQRHEHAGPGKGRKAAMRAAIASSSWRSLLQVCAELAEMRQAIESVVNRAR